VFTRTKYGADKVARMLAKSGIKAEAIHGNKSQNARQRALSNFKDRHIRVLVASDIASRGIDIEEISCVINFEIPNIPETYIHRIGRTGRAGSNGIALSFCDTEERAYLKDIQKLISKTIPVIEDHPYRSANVSAVELQSPVKPNKSSRPNPGNNSWNKKRRWQGHTGR
jgi:ATP-dependent RNA helicase RhlE